MASPAMIGCALPIPAYMPPSRRAVIAHVLPVSLAALRPAPSQKLNIQPLATHFVAQPFHFDSELFLLFPELLLQLRLQFFHLRRLLTHLLLLRTQRLLHFLRGF